MDFNETITKLAQLNKLPIGTKIALSENSLIFIPPGTLHPNTIVGIEKIQSILDEASKLMKQQKLNIDLYEEICRGLLKLDESLHFDNPEVHQLAMQTFYQLMEMHQLIRKKDLQRAMPQRYNSSPYKSKDF